MEEASQIDVYVVTVCEQGSSDYVLLGQRVTNCISVFSDLLDAEECATEAEEEDNFKTKIVRGTLQWPL